VASHPKQLNTDCESMAELPGSDAPRNWGRWGNNDEAGVLNCLAPEQVLRGTQPLLPDRTPKRGGRWRDHREVIGAIAFKFQTGTQWVHLPEKYGNWSGVDNRLRMWAIDGTRERVFTALMTADARCRPLAFVLTAGQAGDAPAFADVMARVRLPRRRGRPRTRPDAILADKAYSSHAIREHLRKRGIRAVIPVPADQRGHRLRRGNRGGRPPTLDREAYKQRNTVERCINRLEQWRAIATRYEKTATIYPAGLHIAGIFRTWRRPPQHRASSWASATSSSSVPDGSRTGPVPR
jgi:transposase